jgi:NADH-quinone oxidoreductase E subunit
MSEHDNLAFSPKGMERLEFLKSRYPTAQALTLPVLHLAQEEFGWVSEPVMEYVAKMCGIPPIEVMETATFYSLYHKTKPGKHCIWMCTNVSCFLNDADKLLAHVENKLGIKPGQVTEDGKFSLFSVECLADCSRAPVAQINEDYHGQLDATKMDQLIDKLAKE